MTDIRISPSCIVTIGGPVHSCTIADKVWRWEDHRYFGPTFLRTDGEPLKNQPGEGHPVWEAYGEWSRKHYGAKR